MSVSIPRFLQPSAYQDVCTRHLNSYILPRLEALLVGGSGDLSRLPPTFILGPPRCGSTLAIQVLTEALSVGFMSNAHCRWHGAPALAEWFLRRGRARVRSSFQSVYGETVGPHGPAECGDWWYRFFPRAPAYISREAFNTRDMQRFRRSVVAFTHASGRPILYKNLYASLRIQAIARSLPESIFVVIYRDEIEIAHSLLAARKKQFGNYDSWFSIEPPNVEQLRALPAHLQALGQVRSIYELIERDIREAGLPARQILALHYADLCLSPSKCVEMYRQKLLENGVAVGSHHVDWPNFSRPTNSVIDPQLYASLCCDAKLCTPSIAQTPFLQQSESQGIQYKS